MHFIFDHGISAIRIFKLNQSKRDKSQLTLVDPTIQGKSTYFITASALPMKGNRTLKVECSAALHGCNSSLCNSPKQYVTLVPLRPVQVIRIIA